MNDCCSRQINLGIQWHRDMIGCVLQPLLQNGRWPESLTCGLSFIDRCSRPILIGPIVNFGNGAGPDLFRRYAPTRRACKQR